MEKNPCSVLFGSQIRPDRLAKHPLDPDPNWYSPSPKLQALVYDILLSNTAVFSYAVGSRKLSANEQFFVGA